MAAKKQLWGSKLVQPFLKYKVTDYPLSIVEMTLRIDATQILERKNMFRIRKLTKDIRKIFIVILLESRNLHTPCIILHTLSTFQITIRHGVTG